MPQHVARKKMVVALYVSLGIVTFMLWLEMSRDETHGGDEWGFGQSLWSPSRKTNGNRWAFWETVLSVEAGDPVLHLVSLDFRVWVNSERVNQSPWARKHLLPRHGHRLRLGDVPPSEEAVLAHWSRTGCYPS